MTWVYDPSVCSAESAAPNLAGKSPARPAGESSRRLMKPSTLNATPIANVSWPSDNAADGCPPAPSGMTLQRSMASLGAEPTWCPGGFHAQTFPAPGRAPGLPESSPACSSKCFALLNKSDLDTSLWRTPQLSLFGGWIAFSGRWPKRGMIVAGRAYRLRTLAHPRNGSDGSHWPTCRAGNPGSRKPGTGGKVLAEELKKAQNGPTAQAQDAKQSGLHPHSRQFMLIQAVNSGPQARALSNSSGSRSGLSTAPTTGAHPNPAWVCCFMGLPGGYTSCEPSAMALSRSSWLLLSLTCLDSWTDTEE